jgi:hypothetical protein
MENVATYSEARSEYTKQLATFIVPSLVGWFQTLWHRNSFDKQRALSLFQSECEEIARWNQDRIHDEVRVLIERSGCDYMEELMTAVFIAHTKVLTAVRLSSKQKKLSITVPKLDHFIHRIFREAARTYWKSPFLFIDAGSVVERQKNVLQIEALATEAITTAVRSLLPVKQILKDYLDGDEDEEIEDDEAEVVAAVAAAEEEPEVEEKKEAVKEEKEAVKEEKKEEIQEVSAPVTVTKEEAADVPTIEVKEIEKPAAAEAPAPAPAVIKIDTEPAAVHFSDYDAVFDEEKGTEMRYTPKAEDDDDYFDDGLLKIDESSAKAVGDDDVEDLDAPAKVVPPAKPAFSEEIGEEEVEILE